MPEFDKGEIADYISDALSDISNALEMLEGCGCEQEIGDLRYVAKRLLDKQNRLLAEIAKENRKDEDEIWRKTKRS